MFIGKYTKFLPYWKYYLSNKITYREFFDERVKKELKKKINKILNKKKFKILKSNFNSDYLEIFLGYHLLKETYVKSSDNYIKKKLSIKKKFFNLKERFNYLNFFFLKNKLIIKTIVKLLNLFLIKSSKIKNKKEYDFLVQFFHGGSSDKIDFPDELYFKDKGKNILTLFDRDFPNRFSQASTQKKIKKDYICVKKLNSKNNTNVYKLNEISNESKKLIKKMFINFFRHPYLSSIFIEYILVYELYYQILKSYKIKVFVHGKTMDSEIAPIRDALDKLNILNINYSRSYLPSTYNDLLTQPDELVFFWGREMGSIYDKRQNKIKYLIESRPYFASSNKKKKKIKINNKYKVISIFDSSFDIDTAFNPEVYNDFMNFALKYIYENKEIFLIVKNKWKSTAKKIQDNDYLKKINKEKRLKIFDKSYSNNFHIFDKSDLIISFASLSVGSEALYYKKDSLNIVANSYKNSLLNSLNKIYPFAYNDLNKAKNIFLEKIEKSINKKKIIELHKYFFKYKCEDHSKKFLFRYIKNYSPKVKKQILINNIINEIN